MGITFCNRVMEFRIVHIDETDSTNRWLWSFLATDKYGQIRRNDFNEVRKDIRKDPCQFDANIVVVAEYQTAGRGCGTNSWESERGKNLMFSVLIHPEGIPARQQFHISMAVSLAVCETLGQHIGDLSIKWPNDIYWRNGKIGGMLIGNQLQGDVIKDSIIGIGLNVNQREFKSNAPNPVSLWQITGQETDRRQLLDDFLHSLERYLYQDVRQQYLQMLYRRKGFHPFTDKNGAFMAEIVDVEDSGHLVLLDDSGQRRRYAFKEVQFVI